MTFIVLSNEKKEKGTYLGTDRYFRQGGIVKFRGNAKLFPWKVGGRELKKKRNGGTQNLFNYQGKKREEGK